MWSKHIENLLISGSGGADITRARIEFLFPFRQDCNLKPLIDALKLVAPDNQTFINNALKMMPPEVSSTQCGILIQKQPPTVANLQNAISRILIF